MADNTHHSHPLTDTAIEHLRKLVAFDSVSCNSNLPILAYIKEQLEALGFTLTDIPSEDGKKANLLARIGAEADGGMVWSGHTDVVPVEGQDWHTPPFNLTPQDDLLFGRGTSDMKSFIACCLAVAPTLAKATLKKPVYFSFSYDEEVGCLGIPSLVQHLNAQQIKPDIVLIGEPTMMQVVTAHKGLYSYETTVYGLEAHSSQPQHGINAVEIACKLVNFLHELGKQQQTDGVTDDRFEPPYSTIHVGTIHGGTARNIIARQCTFHWEIRPVPGEDIHVLYNHFQKECNRIRERIKKISPQADIVTTPHSKTASVSLPEHASDACLKIMHAAGTNQQLAVSFGTEAGAFTEGGFAAVICGPGDIAQAHKPNEFIAIPQISECLGFLERLIASDV